MAIDIPVGGPAGGGTDRAMDPAEIETESGITVKFDYQPNISPRGQSTVKEHQIIGGDAIVQRIGNRPQVIEVTGTTTHEKSWELKEAVNEEFITMVSSDWNGKGFVKSVRIEPFTENTEGFHEGDVLRTFTLRIIEYDTQALDR